MTTIFQIFSSHFWYCHLFFAAFSVVFANQDSTPTKYGEGLFSANEEFKVEVNLYDRKQAQHTIRELEEARKSFESGTKIGKQIDGLGNLANAYQAIGQYSKAADSLTVALTLAKQGKDPERIAKIFGCLGNIFHGLREEEKAHGYLMEGLEIADEIQDKETKAGILNVLGNLYFSQGKFKEAKDTYRSSFQMAGEASNHPLEIKALANAARSYLQLGDYEEAQSLLQTANRRVKNLPLSAEKAFTLINIGLVFNRLRHYSHGNQDELLMHSFEAFYKAKQVAHKVKNVSLQSYAQGYLGGLYEEEERYQEAIELTKSALFLAQKIQEPQSLYRWQWQSGKLFAKMENLDKAISAYRRAIQTIQSIRMELSNQYECEYSSFRASVGPIYLELVDLLLQKAAEISEEKKNVQSFLLEARGLVELLKVDDLRDFFEDECIVEERSKVTNLDFISESAIVVYPILLPQRTVLLISLPSGLKQFVAPVPTKTITAEIKKFSQLLKKRGLHEYLTQAKNLYDWLIRPIEPELTSISTDTLVFVPDGPLRTIPMAALHDGDQFLVAKYALATAPGIDLVGPQPIDKENIKVLSAGLTESVQGFSALPHVAQEMEAIHQILGGQQLQNQGFVAPVLEKEMKEKKFSIIHIASHGQFNSRVEDSFILTYNGKISLDRLSELVGHFRFREQPLELLTLSACETAAGDDRASLGLAGLAIRAGARTAVGTLWVVNDQASSQLITEFYKNLIDPSISRVVALQRAQLKLINDARYNHPYYWSSFLLINNWL